MKICPVGTAFFHADRRTDIMKVIDSLLNFVNATKKAGPRHVMMVPF